MNHTINYPDGNSHEDIKKVVDQINNALLNVNKSINTKKPIISLSSPVVWR
jgi:hypothetical protein